MGRTQSRLTAFQTLADSIPYRAAALCAPPVPIVTIVSLFSNRARRAAKKSRKPTLLDRAGTVLLFACTVLLIAGSGTESAPAPAEPVTVDLSVPTAIEDAMPERGADIAAALNTSGDDEPDTHETVAIQSEHLIDYDTDDDGLIEISTLAQLDAVRGKEIKKTNAARPCRSRASFRVYCFAYCRIGNGERTGPCRACHGGSECANGNRRRYAGTWCGYRRRAQHQRR